MTDIMASQYVCFAICRETKRNGVGEVAKNSRGGIE